MTLDNHPRTAARAPVPGLRAVLVLLATALGLIGCTSLELVADTSSSDRGGGWHGQRSGAAEGEVRGEVSVLDGQHPAIANLDPELLGALRRATGAAAADGIELDVTSGWRSAAYQERLLRKAVEQYGSAAAAARWVVAPEDSRHVSGDAVDIAGAQPQAWLAEHGAAYGLCRVYDNEPWHFELRPRAVTDGCPATYADPTADPRVQQ